MFGGIETDQPQRVLEVGKALASGGVGAAETLAAPFGDRVQRRILQQLRRREFDPGVRRLAELQAKLLDEARLADAGLADNQRELALASRRPLPAPAQEVELLLAPDQRRQRAGAEAPPAARAHDPVERDRRRRAFELVRPALLDDEKTGDLPMHVRRDEH